MDRNRKILVVDDEKNICTLIKNALELEGYEVLVTTDPLEAMAMIEKNNIYIVISDIKMPGMSGLELQEKIKFHNELIQVIMITGYVTMENILGAFRLGALNVFFKPLNNLDDLIDEVASASGKIKRILEVLKQWSSIKYNKGA